MRDLYAKRFQAEPEKKIREGRRLARRGGLDEVVATGQTGRLHAVEVRARQVHQPVG